MIHLLLNGYAFLNQEVILIIGVVALVLFGGSKIPQLMRGLGRGMGEFHAGVAEGKTIMQSSLKAPSVEEHEDHEKKD